MAYQLPPPFFVKPSLKSANCPILPFLGNPPFTLVFCEPPKISEPPGVKIKVFFDQSLLVLTQISHWTLPTATKGFHNAVSPLLCTAFSEAFLISAIKKRLICRRSTFSQLFNSVLFYEKLLWIVILFPTILNSKQNKTDIFAKPKFQCHCTQTTYEI